MDDKAVFPNLLPPSPPDLREHHFSKAYTPLPRSIRQDFISIFSKALAENAVSFERRLTLYLSTGERFERAVLFVMTWFVYALTLCGSNLDKCEQTAIWKLPLATTHSLRTRLFEWLWCYECVKYMVYAFRDGVRWTFVGASRLAHANTPPGANYWWRNGIYMWHFLNLGLVCVLQPLLKFYVCREFGRWSWFDITGTEASCYASVMLKVLGIFLDSLEEAIYLKTGTLIEVTFFLLLGTTLAILDKKGYVELANTSIGRSWVAANSFYSWGENVSKNRTRGPG